MREARGQRVAMARTRAHVRGTGGRRGSAWAGRSRGGPGGEEEGVGREGKGGRHKRERKGKREEGGKDFGRRPREREGGLWARLGPKEEGGFIFSFSF